jgi:hypothetical protein
MGPIYQGRAVRCVKKSRITANTDFDLLLVTTPTSVLVADSAVRLQQAVTLHAVRRWCSAEDSPLHEQARADRVGESLEPGGGGAVWPLKSEVARCDGMAPGSKRSAERTLFLNTVRLRFAQTSTKKQSLKYQYKG